MKPFQVVSGSRETISAPFSCLVSPHADTSSGAVVQGSAETGDSNFLISLYFHFLTGSAGAASPTPPSLGPIAELKDWAAQLPAALCGE